MVGRHDFQQFVGMSFDRTFFVEVRKSIVIMRLIWTNALCGRLRHICSRWGPELGIRRYKDGDKAALKSENSYRDLRNLGENHPLKTLFHLLNPDAICHAETCMLRLSAIVLSTNSVRRAKFIAVRESFGWRIKTSRLISARNPSIK